MKKKAVLIVILSSVVVLVIFCSIYNVVQKQKYTDKYNNAFIALFVTERNAVYSLYEAINTAIETPDQEHYDIALNFATEAERICGQIYGDLSDDVATYGAGLVYYATFYRDIKSAINSNCDVDMLEHIHELLGEILLLYDAHSNPVETTGKIEAITQFYESLSLLNDDMMNLLNYN